MRFDVFGVRLFIKNFYQIACLRIVLAKFGLILVTVHFYEIEAFLIRRPTDICKVTVGRVACIQENAFPGCRIIDTYLYFMAGHSRHRIAYIIDFSHTCGDIYKRVLCYHALIHAIEGQQITFRAPESTFIDTKFIAMYGLSANDAFGFVGHCLLIDVQVIAYRISYITASCAIVFIISSLPKFEGADNAVALKVICDKLSCYCE